MDEKDKIDILAQILSVHSPKLNQLERENLRDYVECISLFLTTHDPIIEESSLKTMHLIIKRTP